MSFAVSSLVWNATRLHRSTNSRRAWVGKTRCSSGWLASVVNGRRSVHGWRTKRNRTMIVRNTHAYALTTRHCIPKHTHTHTHTHTVVWLCVEYWAYIKASDPRVISRGSAVPTVKVLKSAQKLAVHALWTALRIIFWPKCNRLQDFAYTISTFFEGDTLGPLQREGATSSQRPRCLDPDTNFHLARQRSHCYCFTKLSLQSGLCGATNRLIVCGCIDKMLISDVGPAATASSYGVVTDVSANARS